MKNASAYARKITALLRKLKAARKPEPLPPRDPVTQLIIGFLEWNATRKSAEAAYARLMTIMVDNNDVRVSHPPELVSAIGPRYSRAEERAARLHDSLQTVFTREHAMSLQGLAERGKKEARQYLDTLTGMTPYVAAQVTVACFGGHAVPVDDDLVDCLRRAGVVEPEASVEDIEGFLTRHVKAGDALETHLALRDWVDSQADRKKPAAKPAAKKPRKTAKH